MDTPRTRINVTRVTTDYLDEVGNVTRSEKADCHNTAFDSVKHLERYREALVAAHAAQGKRVQVSFAYTEIPLETKPI